jgi:small nuclear ribonucleoprotein (snRNP)-like protein
LFNRKKEPDRPSLLQVAVHSRFVVTLKDQTTFDGLLVDSDASVLILANARVLTDPREQPQTVDGRIYLERVNVEYMQELRS